jgi:hypothetical protein
MHMLAPLLQSDWSAPMGWALIVVGIATALDALLDVQGPAWHLGYLWGVCRPTDRWAPTDAQEPPADHRWPGPATIDARASTLGATVADLQARAAFQIDAAEAALAALLADHGSDIERLRQPRDMVRTPAGEPLAA